MGLRGDSRVVRVEADGTVTDVLTGFNSFGWNNVVLTPEGDRLFVADLGDDKIYEFGRAIPEPGVWSMGLVGLVGLVVLIGQRRRS